MMSMGTWAGIGITKGTRMMIRIRIGIRMGAWRGIGKTIDIRMMIRVRTQMGIGMMRRVGDENTDEEKDEDHDTNDGNDKIRDIDSDIDRDSNHPSTMVYGQVKASVVSDLLGFLHCRGSGFRFQLGMKRKLVTC